MKYNKENLQGELLDKDKDLNQYIEKLMETGQEDKRKIDQLKETIKVTHEALAEVNTISSGNQMSAAPDFA